MKRGKTSWGRIGLAFPYIGPVIGLGIIALAVSYVMIGDKIGTVLLLLHDAGIALVLGGIFSLISIGLEEQ